MRMKSGSRTKPPPDVELQKLLDRWASVKEKLTAESETSMLDKYEEKIGEVIAQAVKLRIEFAKIPGAAALIGKWEEAMIGKERTQQSLEYAKAITAEEERQLKIIQQQYDDSRSIRIVAVEKELNEVKRQREQYLITEGQMIQAEIDAAQKLLKIEQDRLEQGKNDEKNFDATLAKIRELEEKLKNLNVQQKRTMDLPLQGWAAGWKSSLESLDSGFKQMEYLAKETAQAMASAFSDFFFDVITLKTKTFGEYLKSFLTAISRAIANIMAQNVTSGLGGLFASLFGSIGGGPASAADVGPGMMVVEGVAVAAEAHSGGMVEERKNYRIVPSYAFAGARRYHSGVGPGETAAILRNDEGVFTPGQMKALGSKLSGQGGMVVNNFIYALDTQTFADVCKRNPGVIVSIVGDAIKDNTSLRYMMKDMTR
jgi:hypothetical protein